MIRKILGFTLGALIIISGLAACHKKDDDIKVGVIAGPEQQLMETALDVAKKRYHLDTKIVSFSDYNVPNAALNDGSIDVNMVQHLPFLEQQIAQRHYSIVAIGKTFIYPVGIYSKKVKDLADLEQGSHVAIPNDPTNEARALLLLEKAKLIELNPKAGFNATPLDVTSNPYHLVFSELESAEIPRALNDVDLAVINTNYAIPAGLSPTKDALFHEDANSPYMNVIVVRTQDKNNPQYAELVKAFQSKEVLEKAKLLFGDGAVPGFEVKKDKNQ